MIRATRSPRWGRSGVRRGPLRGDAPGRDRRRPRPGPRGLVPAATPSPRSSSEPGRRGADRGDRADDRPRRHRLRQRRSPRPSSAGGPLPPPRPDEQRRRRHRPRAPAPRRRRAAPGGLRPLLGRPRRARPGRGGDRDDGPDPLRPRRADDIRAQARRLGVRARPRADAPRAAVDEIGTGKISGPVGTYSHLDPDLEAEVSPPWACTSTR
jgi:hypothetical protein